MIRVLPPNVVNQIAAGEVVERPFSVVKELVENSLDAGATRIHVALEDGGRVMMRVTDDGAGFSPADLELAFVSHATSKLSAAADLDHIASLGFRGEALASIGSIARVSIRSRTAEDDGHEIRCEGGAVEAVRPTSCPPGTTLEVRDLFYNTPARRRFLKTPRAERARIQELLSRLGLAREDVDFTLECDGKEVLRLPAGEGLQARIARVFSQDVAEAMHPVDVRRGDMRVYGFTGDPDASRRDSTQELLYINGRLAKDKSATHAVRQAYREYLMGGRFPGYVLMLAMPPDAVDVNVHPTKSEVRFLDGRAVCGLLHEGVRNALAARSETMGRQAAEAESTDFEATAEADGGGGGGGGSSGSGRGGSAKPTPRTGFPDMSSGWFGSSAETSSVRETPSKAGAASGGGLMFDLDPAGSVEGSDPQAVGSDPRASAGDATTAGEGAVPGDSRPHPFRDSGLETQKYLQIHDLYLVFQDSRTGGMVVVDQHALHERVVYEQLVALHDARGETPIVQQLLVPEVLELSPRDKAYLLDAQDVLAEQGFLIDDFGGNAVAIQGVPAVLTRARPKALVESFLLGGGDSSNADPASARPRAREAVLERFHSMACRSSVMSGDRLDDAEIRALLVAASQLQHPHNCPHGRPTVLQFSAVELEKFFRRRLS